MFLYEIKNLKNSRAYIGVTVRNPKDRYYEHLYSLKRNVHHNRHLQAAYNLYGKENFNFSILSEHSSIESLKASEESKILELGDMAYNLAIDSIAFYHSSKARAKIVKAQLIPVIGMRIKDGFIKEFGSSKDASEVANSKSIGSCCKNTNNRLSCNGWVWMYLKDYKEKPLELEIKRNKAKISKSRVFSNEWKAKKAIEMKEKFSKNGNFFEKTYNLGINNKSALYIYNEGIEIYKSATDLASFYKVGKRNLMKKLKGERNSKFLQGFVIYKDLVTDKNLLVRAVEDSGLNAEIVFELLKDKGMVNYGN